nr:MAG TPA: hypothetical protein [Caudoviricetes sp.]
MSHAMMNEVTNITGSNFIIMSPHSFNFDIVILNNKNIVGIKICSIVQPSFQVNSHQDMLPEWLLRK